MQEGKKVVLVVGTPASVTATVIGLVKAGYAVECVSDGRAALERLACGRGKFDAMVIGAEMDEAEQIVLNGDLKKGDFSELPLIIMDGDLHGTSACTNDYAIVPDDPGLVVRQLERTTW